MADSETPQEEVVVDSITPQKTTSIKRFGLSTTMILQVVAALVILLAVNFLVNRHGKQIDLTKRSSYTLTGQTKENLSADLVQNREQAIKITAVLNPNQFAILQGKTNESVVSRIHAKLQEYKDHSKGKIELQFVNPIIDHGRTQELSESYNYQFAESVIIIDARDGSKPDAKWLEEAKRLNPKFTEEQLLDGYEKNKLSQHVRFLPARELFVEHYDPVYERPFISNWKDETEISTNLLRAIEGKPKTIYFPFDKCRVDSKHGGRAPWQNIKAFYRNQNINLKEIRLANIDRIPDDADGIALIAPSVDFTDREIAILREYWEARDKSSILITLEPEQEYLPKLYSYLWKSSGLRPRKDRIIKKQDGQILVSPEVEFLPGPQVNGKLANNATTFDGASQSIEVIRADDVAIKSRNVEAFPLIKVSPGWWGESRFGRQEMSYDERSDSPNPLYLAAAVTRGSLANQLTAPLVSKMVIIGNSDFMTQENIRQEQITYMNQVGNWLVGREELLNIRQEANIPSKVFIRDGHKNFLNKIFVAFLPLIALLITGFVWNIRRS